MKPLSYQLFVFSDDFSHLSVNDDDVLSFLRSFDDFLPQRNQGIEFEVKDDKIIQKAIDSIDLRSIDNKWSIDFKPKKISLSYNHVYPKDIYSLNEFSNDVLKLIHKISDKILFDKSFRLGFVRNSAKENSESFISENPFFLDEKINVDEIIEKNIRFTLRKNSSTLGEYLNHVRSITFSSDAKIKAVGNDQPSDFSGIHIFDDINTLASNLTPRFGIEKIESFLTEVKSILG